MKIDVHLTDKDEAYIIKNLYPLYLYDLSGHYGGIRMFTGYMRIVTIFEH